ncbi:MAG TPA: transcriptional regulator [Pyrinomonadaceae bacterium]
MAVSSDGSESYEFGEFRIDVGRRLLLKRNERLNLTPKAFDTLVCLVANAGEVVEKDELMERVWPETVVEENNLNQNISSLRRVFGEKRGDHRYIATIPGRGYKFVADVRTAPVTADDAPSSESEPTFVKRYFRSNSLRIGLAVFLVAFAVLAIYLAFRQDPESLSSGPRKIAVFPFSPLVQDFRDEALEVGMADTFDNPARAERRSRRPAAFFGAKI